MAKARLWWAFAAAITLQLFILYYQINYGALVGLVPWDDCAILVRGLRNLAKLEQAHSLWHMLRAASHLYFHAPVADVQDMVGLLVTGGALWGPYVLNVIWLCIAIYAISTTAALKDSIAFGASVLFLLVQPITFIALSRLISDWQGSILLAAAMFVLFDSAETNNNHGRILGSVLLGLMAITKMTAFYVPVLALGVFLVFEFYGALKHTLALNDALDRSQAVWKAVLARFGGSLRLRAICIALILVPYLLFFYQARHSLLPYIYQALGPKWDDGLTMPERLLFYSPLGNGTFWGGLHFMFLIFFAAGLIAALLKRNWLHVLACVGILPIAGVYLAPLALAHINPSFGAPFYGTIVGGTLILMRIFVANTPRWGALISPIIVLALAFPTALPLSPQRDLTGALVSRADLQHYQSINDDIAENIARQSTRAQPKIVVMFDFFLMPVPNLTIRYFQRTGDFLWVDRIDDLANQNVTSLVANADFALTMTPTGQARTVPNLWSRMPISRDPASGDARVRESGRFELVSSYLVRGGKIWLYRAHVPH